MCSRTLADRECDKIQNFHENFVAVDYPAMKGVSVSGWYVGRPFGGVAVLVHK